MRIHFGTKRVPIYGASGSKSWVVQPVCGIDPTTNETITSGDWDDVTCKRCLKTRKSHNGATS